MASGTTVSLYVTAHRPNCGVHHHTHGLYNTQSIMAWHHILRNSATRLVILEAERGPVTRYLAILGAPCGRRTRIHCIKILHVSKLHRSKLPLSYTYCQVDDIWFRGNGHLESYICFDIDLKYWVWIIMISMLIQSLKTSCWISLFCPLSPSSIIMNNQHILSYMNSWHCQSLRRPLIKFVLHDKYRWSLATWVLGNVQSRLYFGELSLLQVDTSGHNLWHVHCPPLRGVGELH